LNICAVLS
jgi:hypothetical protein